MLQALSPLLCLVLAQAAPAANGNGTGTAVPQAHWTGGFDAVWLFWLVIIAIVVLFMGLRMARRRRGPPDIGTRA